MSEASIISYNSAKLTEIEQEIADLGGDLKLPVKITNSEGKIKKALIYQTKAYPTSMTNYVYLKYPSVPKIEGTIDASVELNFKVVGKKDDYVFSLYKLIIYTTTTGTKCTIDNTHNALKLEISTRALVYYTDDAGKNHYYFKLLINTTFPTNLTYLDVSTDSYIPDDFSFDDMLVTSLPKPESSLTYTFKLSNPHLIAARKGTASNGVCIITTSSSLPRQIYPDIYSDTSDASWSTITTGISGITLWKYSGA
jgi:hypothetical protein